LAGTLNMADVQWPRDVGRRCAVWGQGRVVLGVRQRERGGAIVAGALGKRWCAVTIRGAGVERGDSVPGVWVWSVRCRREHEARVRSRDAGAE
jgi:hypothetical protein